MVDSERSASEMMAVDSNDRSSDRHGLLPPIITWRAPGACSHRH